MLAEWTVGSMFWSMLWFFLFVMWIWLVISIFSDIMRSDDMGGGSKAIWSIFIIFIPFLGIFIYLIVRGGKMGERTMAKAQANEAQMQDYIRQTAGGGGSADELAKLADLHAAGRLDDAEFAQAKAKILG